MRRPEIVIATILFSCAAFATNQPHPHACHTGAYRLDNGDRMVITTSWESALRYVMPDGRSGRLYPTGPEVENPEFVSGEGFAEREPVTTRVRFQKCTAGRFTFSVENQRSKQARRIDLPAKSVRFTSGGVSLYGKLHLPVDSKPRALVVLVQGSGNDSAVIGSYQQHMLPLQGIATFVYDKRGTGQSEGQLSANFDLLANDTVAAVAAARKLIGTPAPPVGLLGESQGGWIAPLAATRTPVDFTVVAYGLAIRPLDEDREEVLAELRSHGYGEDVIAKGRELTDATAHLVASMFTAGYEDLRRVKDKYSSEPWFSQVEGDYTGPILRAPENDIRGKIASMFPMDIIVDYDAMPVLRSIRSPMLWVLAGKDTEAPMPPTLENLRSVQPQPGQLDIAIFPNADHGIIDVVERNGERHLVSYSPGYQDLLAYWIVNRSLQGSFGSAVLMPDAKSAQKAD